MVRGIKCIALIIYFFHLAMIAFLPISLRLFADSALALALPPLEAPSLDSSTAWGLRVSGFGGGTLPVARSITSLAICVKSLRLAML